MEILCISIALLFITNGAPVNAQSGGDGDGEDDPAVVYYDINRLNSLTLNCSLPNADKTLSYVWKKGNDTVEEATVLKGRYSLIEDRKVFTLTVKTVEDDYGKYSCAVGAEEIQWDVRGRPHVRLPDNTNVVEGQKIKLQCKVIGKPYPPVTWSYNASKEANASELLVEGSRGRVRLEANEQGAPGAALVLEAAERADAGYYSCHAAGAEPAATQLRVKDMYAALWPFLGICAEVFVLCVIILVYEKRRTKPELDDSDTDNHDQKKS